MNTDATVEQLRRRVHRLQLGLAFLAGVVAVSLWYAVRPVQIPAPSEPPADLVARSLTILDAEGRPVAILAGDPRGGLTLLDTRGTIRAAISAGEDGPSVALTDAKGAVRCRLDVDDDGSATVALTGDRGRSAVLLHSDVGGRVLVEDRRGDVLFQVPPPAMDGGHGERRIGGR